MKKSILNRIQTLGRRYGAERVFNDLVQMSVCAMAMGTFEEVYFETIKTYDKEDLHEFPKMFGEICMLFTEELKTNDWTDFLGDIMEEIGLTNQRNGQFLTPKGVCDMMAQFNGDYADKRVLDPSIGTGRLILAIKGVSEELPAYVEGVDVDLRACNISALNLMAHGFKGRIIWGNSLSLETWRVFEINMHHKIPIRMYNDTDYLRKQFEAINQIQEPKVLFQKPMALDNVFVGDLFA